MRTFREFCKHDSRAAFLSRTATNPSPPQVKSIFNTNTTTGIRDGEHDALEESAGEKFYGQGGGPVASGRRMGLVRGVRIVHDSRCQ